MGWKGQRTLSQTFCFAIFINFGYIKSIYCQKKVREKQRKSVLGFVLLKVVKGILYPCHPLVLFVCGLSTVIPNYSGLLQNFLQGIKGPWFLISLLVNLESVSSH